MSRFQGTPILSAAVALALWTVPSHAQGDSAPTPMSPEISGQVLYDTQPVAGANVWLVESEYRLGVLGRFRLGPRITDNQGKFSFDSGLEPGREYYVLAERHVPSTATAGDIVPIARRSLIEATTYYGDAPSLTTALPITLGPREHRQQVNIRMRTAVPYCVSGRVEVYGMPFALYLTIQESALARTDRSIHGDESKQDGSFRFCGLTPGEYALFTPENGSGMALFSIADADVQGVVLSVDTTPPELQLEVACDGDAQPRSEVQSPDLSRRGPQNDSTSPDPHENRISVRLLREDGESFAKTAVVPFAGTFEPVSAGAYAVDVTPPAGRYVKRLTLSGVRPAEGILHLSPGSKETLGIVVSPGAGTIKCEVIGEGGGPMPDTAVALIPAGTYTPAQLSVYARQMRTDSSGVFEVGALSPGDY